MSQHTMSARLWFVAILSFALTNVFLVYEMCIQVLPSIMTQQLMADLAISAAGVGQLGAFYFIPYTFMQIPYGYLYDRMSARTILILAIIICALGAYFGASEHYSMVAFGRFLNGFSSACAYVGSLVIAGIWFPKNIFPFLVGITQIMAGVGGIVSEHLGAYLVENFDRSGALWYLTIAGFAIALIMVLFLKDKSGNQEKSKKEPVQIKEAMRAILARSQNWWVSAYAFFNWSTMIVFSSLWGVSFYTTAYGISVSEAATLIDATWIGMLLASPVIGFLAIRISYLKILSTGSMIGFISAMIAIYCHITSFPLLFLVLMILGGCCACHIVTFSLIKEINPEKMSSTAVGFNNMAVVASGFILQPLSGFLLNMFWDGTMVNEAPVYTPTDFFYCLWIIPCAFACCWLIQHFKISRIYANSVD